MDKRINVETSGTVAALFPAVKNRSRARKRGNFAIKLGDFYGKMLNELLSRINLHLHLIEEEAILE